MRFFCAYGTIFKIHFLCTLYIYSRLKTNEKPKTNLGEGVRRNALRVLRPKSPHSEEIAQYIEWRTPCGCAAVWL